jgi:hypothetical protein
MVLLPPPGLTRASLHDYRLGYTLDALFAANLNKVLSAVALKALEVYAIATPWLHQDTTTIAQQGGPASARPHRAKARSGGWATRYASGNLPGLGVPSRSDGGRADAGDARRAAVGGVRASARSGSSRTKPVTSMYGGSAWPAEASLCSARIASTGPQRHGTLDASGSTCNDGGRASGRFPG